MMALLASPLIKYLGIAAAIVAVVGFIWWKGYDLCVTKHDAEIMTQALAASENMRKANDNTARVQQAYAETMAQLVSKENQYIAIKEQYEKTAKAVPVSPDLVRAVDDTSRVYNAGANSMPAASVGATGTPGTEETVPTSIALLGAYGYCAEQLERVYTAYSALVDFEVTSRAIANEGAGF